ncbi:MAG: dTDP-4-dehydrorhamnose reductase [Candidatus Bathyarchaeota archaeon]|nr:dTDP-4-dehydrorhamnose reductase [Candidatus Bathyarchaeota archaeon]
MNLLITGASGLYGSKLAEKATANYAVYSGYCQDPPAFGNPIQFDISDRSRIGEVFKKVNPAVVVHAAALTDVDKCETNKKLAWQINVEGTRNIVKETKANHAFLVYISTDYVFNGEAGNYKENDQPDPINYYGFTKLKAEKLVKDTVDDYCIARASVIYGSTPAAGKVNYALWVLDKLRRNEQIKIITDQWNSPTLNTNLVDMTLEVIERRLTGTFHLSGATRISRYDFAALIAQTFDLNEKLIKPSASAEFSWSAKRPTDSSLNTAKAQQTLKNKPLQISQALEKMKQEVFKYKQ